MGDYGQAFLIDVVTVSCCIGLLLRFGDLRFSHPATPYIAFHGHTVTSRLAGLLGGAGTLYSQSPGWFDPVSPDEIVRAALYCDFAFWSVTVVWILFNYAPRHANQMRHDAMKLDPGILRPILYVAFLVGVVGLRVSAQIPGVSQFEGIDASNPWAQSSYLYILPAWSGLAVLGYGYYFGFGRLTSILLAAYLVLMSLQGGMRYRAIIGLLLAIQIWVDRRNRRWPSRSITLLLVAAALLFFPMKTLGIMAQRGTNISEVSTVLTESVTEVAEGSAPDHMFLDEFASALTLMDLSGKKYFGSMYLPILTLPIPRALWPDKPGLAGFLADISTSHRPMAVSGMITTYLGEAYANFGLTGIFLVPPLLALFLAAFYRRAQATPRDSVWRFSYVLLSVNLIQVYRDGLVSIVVFTFVNMMPLVVVVIAHVWNQLLIRRRHIALANFSEPAITPTSVVDTGPPN